MRPRKLVQEPQAKEWAALAVAALPASPPYPEEMPVTRLSTFGQECWEYPKKDLPPGSHLNRFIRFYAPSIVNGSSLSLQRSDTVLVRQLKEVAVAFMFRQSVIEHKVALAVPKPRTVTGFVKNAKRIFVAAKWQGRDSIFDLSVTDLERTLSALASTQAEQNKLIDVFSIIIHFSKSGLVSGGHMTSDYPLLRRRVLEDSSKATGAQTLTDRDLQVALKVSRFYVEHAEEIISLLQQSRSENGGKKEVQARLNSFLPLKRELHEIRIETVTCSLLKVACYNFLGWHLGARISEILSARRGFIATSGSAFVLALDFISLQLEVRKSVAAVHGNTKAFAVHPYLGRVARVLEKISDFEGLETDYLFTSPRSEGILDTNTFNHLLKRFARLHGYSDQISSHTWRNTLISVSVRAVAEPLGPLAHLLGHKHLSTVVAYALSNPFVRSEMRTELSRVMSPKVDRFLAGSRHFGGSGLRGPQGLMIEKSLDEAQLHRGDVSELRREITAQMVSGNISLTPVCEGVECIKPTLAKGLCTRGNGDILADTEGCRNDCAFRAEYEPARERLRHDINSTPAYINNADVSVLMKVRWASDIMQRLFAWPELEAELIKMTELHPTSKLYFEDLPHAQAYN